VNRYSPFISIFIIRKLALFKELYSFYFWKKHCSVCFFNPFREHFFILNCQIKYYSTDKDNRKKRDCFPPRFAHGRNDIFAVIAKPVSQAEAIPGLGFAVIARRRGFMRRRGKMGSRASCLASQAGGEENP
jgi:hypothetical protein